MGNRGSSMLQDEEIKLISEETGFSPAQIERLYIRFKSLDKSGICGSLSRQDFLRVPELAINPLCDRIVHMFFVDCDDDHERINFRQFMRVLATFKSSAKPTRQRNASRQESIQSIWSGLSAQNRQRHLRHSSCDGFFNYYPVQHHTTNQHSIHYVASATHLAHANPFGSYMGSSSNNNNHMGNSANHFNGLFKKPYPPTVQNHPLVDPDEPANSRKQKLLFMFKIYDVDNDNRISLSDLKEILIMMVGSYIDESKLDYLAEKTMRHVDKNRNGYIEFDEFCTAFLHLDIDEALKVKFYVNATRDTKTQSTTTSTTMTNAPATTTTAQDTATITTTMAPPATTFTAPRLAPLFSTGGVNVKSATSILSAVNKNIIMNKNAY